jgi:membrane protein
MQKLRRAVITTWDAIQGFNNNDGWAIASHVALTSLMALFPFLIFLTSVAAFFDLKDQAATVVELIFQSLPDYVAGPIAGEVQNVLLVQRSDLLTIGVALTLWFASSGVEALRVGLNRAYGVVENRWFFWLRLESIAFVLLGTVVLLTLAFMVVLLPVGWHIAVEHLPWLTDVQYLPWLTDFEQSLLIRYGATVLVLFVGLTLAHQWLPAGRRRVLEVLPGVAITMAAWILGGIGFATYLSNFANYASTYAGLAGVMTALVFLYLIAVLLLFGASINAAMIRARKQRLEAKAKAGGSLSAAGEPGG